MPPGPSSPEHAVPGLLAQLSVLWRRKFTILLVVVLAVGTTIAIDSRRTPIYRAQATVGFLSQGIEPATGNRPPLTATQLTTAVEIMTSAPVRDEVTKKLGHPAPPATVALVGSTQIAQITVTSAYPKLAAAAANAYIDAYIATSQARFVGGQLATEGQIQAQIDQLQLQINQVQAQLTTTPTTNVQSYTELSTRLASLYTQQSTYKNQLSAIQVGVSQGASGAQVVIPASVPTSPISPKKLNDALIGLLIGLLLGCTLAFVRDHFDDRIRSKDDLQRVLGTTPILGLIPVIQKWKVKSKPYLAIVAQPSSPAAESYRSLRTAIQFVAVESSLEVIQVTSPGTGDGKTTTVANLAVAMAATGKRVIVIDCDMRRPRIHTYFDLHNEVGVTSVLAGEVSLDDALFKVPEMSIEILSSGPKPPNPAELLSSKQMRKLIDRLRSRADVVLIDSAPVLPVTDATALASQVDGLLLVPSTYSSTQRQVTSSLETLRMVNAPLIGVVLNGASQSDTYYYYGYYYGSDASETKNRAVPRPARDGVAEVGDGLDAGVRSGGAPAGVGDLGGELTSSD